MVLAVVQETALEPRRRHLAAGTEMRVLKRNWMSRGEMIKFIGMGGGLLAVATVVWLLVIAGRLSPPRHAHEARTVPAANLPTGCHC
jgi:hypothetical protein